MTRLRTTVQISFGQHDFLPTTIYRRQASLSTICVALPASRVLLFRLTGYSSLDLGPLLPVYDRILRLIAMPTHAPYHALRKRLLLPAVLRSMTVTTPLPSFRANLGAHTIVNAELLFACWVSLLTISQL